MVHARLPVLICLLVLAAGCTRPQESGDGGGPDRGDYKGGHGVAIHLANKAADPFSVLVRVLGIGDAEPARVEVDLAPNQTVERWFPLPNGETYSARLSYTWSGRAGSVSGGEDEQVFTAADCPEVTRLSWTMRQAGNVVGTAFEGRSCVDA